MFALDVETAGIESTSVVLSIALTHFDFDTSPTYEELLDNSIFVKLDAKIQLDNGRNMDKSTLDWWSRQAEIVIDTSFKKKPDDLHPEGAYMILRKWMSKFPDHKDPQVWARGGLDQLTTESLGRTFDIGNLFPYNNFSDVRTFVDLVYPRSKKGYIEVGPRYPGEWDVSKVIKHHPVHDCAYDITMMLYGRED